jgi:hypothetical protein
MYYDEIGLNVTVYPLTRYGVFLVKTNTTPAKHADLLSRAGVRQFPQGITFDTVINTLSNPFQNAIQNFCTDAGLPFDATETIGGLFHRLILSDICDFAGTSITTQYNALPQSQKNSLDSFLSKWGYQGAGANETIKGLGERLKHKIWDAELYNVEEF